DHDLLFHVHTCPESPAAFSLHGREPGRLPGRHAAQHVRYVFVAVAPEERRGDRAAVSGAADHCDGPVFWDLTVPILQHATVDMQRAIDVPAVPLALRTDVQHEWTLLFLLQAGVELLDGERF